MAITVRTCSSLTKDGRPCPVAPVTGQEWCMGHAPDEIKDAQGFGRVAARLGGRPRLIRSIERLQELEDEKADELARVHLAIALNPDAEPHVRMRAVEYIHDRLAGKPTQRAEVEHSGDLQTWLLTGKPLDDSDGDV